MADNGINIKFTEILIELIESQNFSKNKVASALDITPSALTHYLSGETLPRLDVLIRMAEYFKVSLDYLVLGKAAEDRMAEEQMYFTNMMATSVIRAQERDETYHRLYTRIAELLRQEIKDATHKAYSEFDEIGANLILEKEMLELERHTRASDAVAFEMWDDIVIDEASSDIHLGAFFHAVVENLRRSDLKYQYRLLYSHQSRKMMQRITQSYRRTLRQYCSASAINRYSIGFTKYPLFTGCVLYHLLPNELEAHQPVLFEQVKNSIDDDGWLGCVTSSATIPQSNIIMDLKYLRIARQSFEQMWRDRYTLK